MRAYFCLYHSVLEETRELSNEEFGRLMRALLYYSMTGEEDPELALTRYGRYLFCHYADRIDRERERYERACRRNGRKEDA